MFYLTRHSTHFYYGYNMASDIWLRTIQIVREETRCRHYMGYSFRLAARAGLKPIGPIAPNWAPRPILQTLMPVHWELGPTEIVPNWAPHLLRPALLAARGSFICKTPTDRIAHRTAFDTLMFWSTR